MKSSRRLCRKFTTGTPPETEETATTDNNRFVQMCKASFLCVKRSVAEDLTSVDELALALQHAGLNPSRTLVSTLWSQGGIISFAKFCDLVHKVKEVLLPSMKLLEAFQKLDREQTGFIEYEELVKLVTTKGERMTLEECRTMFGTKFVTTNGKFRYLEFCDHVQATTELCRQLSVEKMSREELEFRKNCNTFVIKRKNDRSRFVTHMPSVEHFSFNNLKNWHLSQSKGCFYRDEDGAILSHQYTLSLPVTSNVIISIKSLGLGRHHSKQEPLDVLLFVIKDGENTSRQFVTFTEFRSDDFGGQYLGAKFEAGRYTLLPFTSGCTLEPKTTIDSELNRVELVSRLAGGKILLTSTYRSVLKQIFDMIDLDGNGRLSRQEFSLFQWRTCGEEIQDDEWLALKENFEVIDGELTLNGFIDAHLAEAENNDGDSKELWSTLFAMGYNDHLILDKALSFLVQVGVQEHGHKLRVSALKNGSAQLDRAVTRIAMDCGDSVKIKNLNDLIAHTLITSHWATIVVQNKAHSKVSVRLDCSASENCRSQRGLLDYTVEVAPKSITIGHHLIPAVDDKSWKVECVHSVIL